MHALKDELAALQGRSKMSVSITVLAAVAALVIALAAWPEPAAAAPAKPDVRRHCRMMTVDAGVEGKRARQYLARCLRRYR
jgi:hypothetical protein